MTPGPDLTSSPSSHSIVQSPSKCRISSGRDVLGPRHAGASVLLPYLTSNSRNSMSITNTKGLLNMPGQNNCFLNSAVQVLWHLDIFRRSFRELTGHACMAESCIFCALKELFAQFQYSQESALPPDALRRALAETFSNQRRFQLGFMDDAAECFENILLRIHFHIANKESEDMCSASHCIPHQKFAMTLVEQTVCHACGATSEPLPFTQMIHYVPSSALCSQAKVLGSEKDDVPGFGDLLRRAGGLGDLRDCPSSCGTVIQIRKTLMNRPEIVSIGLVWDSEKPTIDHIMEVFSTIGMTLKLQDVFHSVVDSRWAATAVHQLVGIVTYYGKHYSTFFFHTKLRVWIYFDDAAVREIGPKWEQVVDKCCRGHFQPLLLLYANPYGTSISTTTAPHNVVVVGSDQKFYSKNGNDVKAAEKQRKFSHAQSNETQRRAVTPNPETSHDANASIQPRRAVTPNGDVSNSCLEKVKSCAVSNGVTGDRKHESSSRNSNSFMDFPTQMNSCWNSKELINKFGATGNIDCLKEKLTQSDQKAQLYHTHRISCKPRMPCDSNAFPKRSLNFKSNFPVQSPSTLSTYQNHRFLSHGANKETVSDQKSENFEEDKGSENAYISRRAVENVLHLQKLRRQKSVNAKNGHVPLCQRSSNSSLESLENIYATQDKSVGTFYGMKFDFSESMNVRRRDSGNWSGDRNSASSSSTTSLDNPHFYAMGNKRSFSNGRIISRGSALESTSTDPGYDSFSLSSSDSYPSVLAFCPGKADPRLGQIPENQQTAFVPYDVAHLQHCVQDLSKKSENHVYGFRDECEKLCIEADIFLAKSVERENIGDISMAALLSDSAAAKARAAMDILYTSPHSLSLAKLKHSMCIIRSCSLQKKLKEAVAAQHRRRDLFCKTYQNHSSSHETLHSDQSLLKKIGSDKHTCIQSKDSNRSCTPHKHSSVSDSSAKNIEIYATLPKKSLKKKNSLLLFVDSLTTEDSSSDKCTKAKDEWNFEKIDSSESFQSDSVTSQYKSSGTGSDTGSTKSYKKKSRMSPKHVSKDSDLSDYSSEWEHNKKTPLYRTYSGPPSQSKDASDDMADESNFSTQQTKKQHRIRRKLIGGFMKRKNRSLPDLREGQDQNSNLSRAYDDCDISQAPLSLNGLTDRNHKLLLKKMHQNLNKTVAAVNTSSSQDCVSKQGQCFMPPAASKNRGIRAHTPPPYKPPPPPVTASGGDGDLVKRRVVSHSKGLCNKALASSFITVHSSQLKCGKEDSWKSQICGKEGKNSQNQVAAQNNSTKKVGVFGHNSQELPKGCVIWLKELQIKQEELIRKKKLQEERFKQQLRMSEISSNCHFAGNIDRYSDGACGESVSSRSIANGNDGYSCPDFLSDDLVLRFHAPTNLPNSDAKDNDQNNSVRYLASKFEKISQPGAQLSESDMSSNIDVSSHILENHVHSSIPESQKCVSVGSEGHLSVQLYGTVQQDMLSLIQDSIQNPSHKHQVVSSNVHAYSPHLSDAQLSNVLHIGVNSALSRNSCLSVLKDGVYAASTNGNQSDISSRMEVKRPEKPPDYETAIQRLELIRGDRGHVKNLDVGRFSCIDVAFIDQDKRRRSPKKSVTFSDKVVLVACAGDEDNDFLPNPLLQRVYKEHMMQSVPPDANSKGVNEDASKIADQSSTNLTFDDKSLGVINLDVTGVSCNLCHNKTAIASNLYCTNCAFYMSRFQK